MSDPRLRGPGDSPLLALRDVTLAFGPKVIQHDLAFDVHRGSIFAVMGGSGCGKSTVLKSMIGLLRPRAGNILVEGEDYWGGSRGAPHRDRPALRRAVPKRGTLECADGRRERGPADADVHQS